MLVLYVICLLFVVEGWGRLFNILIICVVVVFDIMFNLVGVVFGDFVYVSWYVVSVNGCFFCVSVV